MLSSKAQQQLISTATSNPLLVLAAIRPTSGSHNHQVRQRLSINVKENCKRFVGTTSTSKTVQPQEKHQRAIRKEENDIESEQRRLRQQVAAEKFEARAADIKLWHSVETIKRLGHRLAKLDPLDLARPRSINELTWSHSLIDQFKASNSIVKTKPYLETKQPLMPVNELIGTVMGIYANNDCGLEFAHMSSEEEVEWLTSEWEKLNELCHLDSNSQQNLAKLLLECEAFDHFMATKYPTVKRYGCEGAESMLVVFDEILRLCHLGNHHLHPSQSTMRTSSSTYSDELAETIGRISDVIIGMPHRGRLNLLACLLDFDPVAIFNKARGESELDLQKAWMAKGDVLSHLSTNLRYVYGLDSQHIGLSRDTPEPVNVTLLPNPSHLEVAAPMAAGAARGRAHNLLHGYSSSPKFFINNQDKQSLGSLETESSDSTDYKHYLSNVLPIQVHGDASVAGQGIIQETLQMSNLSNFTVNGSLHLIVNNQLGFTTSASIGRSSRYCSDVFKLIEAPIIHVNGQNITNVIRATRLALSYRQRFKKDVVVDLICYRQHGHNEMDEPSFTQPVMYSKIKSRKSIPQSYCDELGIDQEQRKHIADSFKERLQDSHKMLDLHKPDNDNFRNFELPNEYYRDHICSWQTGCELEVLRQIALDSVGNLPQGFSVHPNLERVLIDQRRQRFQSPVEAEQLAKTQVDWATAEILAFGSLLKQNHSVRLAGQDVARGTFSTRHAILFDQKTEQAHIPLNHMDHHHQNHYRNDLSTNSNATTNHFQAAGDVTTGGQFKKAAKLEVANTILSEEAALAYEYGYSTETCELTIWEAQFGDFHNTAQSILDTLVASGESKWLKQSPLTILLPHGLDGAGPEHSSARIERFLQLSSSSADSIDTEAKVNWSVCFPTQPSQYFHLLRRQILRPFRKPLVIAAPKIIFRHPDCVSELAEFSPSESFKPILDDPLVDETTRDQVDTIVLCSGKVYFSLKEEKVKNEMNNVALVRIEELCPFPIHALNELFISYPAVKRNNFVWFQEEHKNQGAYGFVDTRLANMANIKLRYIGRDESELPAVGISTLHKKELEQVMRQFRSLRR